MGAVTFASSTEAGKTPGLAFTIPRMSAALLTERW